MAWWWPFKRRRRMARKRYHRSVRGGAPERTDADLRYWRVAPKQGAAPSPQSAPLSISEGDRVRLEAAREVAAQIDKAMRPAREPREPEQITDAKLQTVVDASKRRPID